MLMFGDTEEELSGGVDIIFLHDLGTWDSFEFALFLT